DAGEGDVRGELARLAAEADALAGAFDLLAQPLELRRRRDARPDRMRPRLSPSSAVEGADAADNEVEARRADRPERLGKLVGQRPLDLADEAQCQVQVVLVDPAGAVEGFHRIDERVANRFGRADADEQ